MIHHSLRLFILIIFLAGTGGGLQPRAAQAQAETNVADPETIHIVQRGETLSSIARRYGVTVAALMAYNSLTSTTIYVGQHLLIPGGGSTPVVYHTVQRGETLFSISRRYGVTVQAIRAANGLSSNLIYVGQRLIIPTGGGSTPVVYHTVQRGETLFSISRRYGVTVQAIQAANRLTSTTIYVGQRLLIPSGGSTPVVYHTVQRGETLFSISRRYGVTVQAIRAANGLSSNLIYVGQRLLIPGGSTPGQGQRIEFAPGQSSARVTGVVQAPEMDLYLLRASQGQTVRIELISSDASALLGVTGVSDGVAYKPLSTPGTVFEHAAPLTQDYQIRVATNNTSTVSYEMLAVIMPGTAPAPTRITFASGATSATVSGVVSTVEPARYVVGAQGGQQMTVTLTATNASAYITVLHPNGDNLAGSGTVRQWNGIVPLTGDYIIEVRNPGPGSTNYSLTVRIV
jgi:LysM repeat protein